MKLATCCIALAFAAPALAADNPFEAFKGKMKPGNYEMSMEMDMSQVAGMPPGMGKQTHKFMHCITDADIEKGAMSKGRDGKGGMPENCKILDFKMSGNTASYRMECTGERAMTADNKITFVGDGYDMDMKMQMTMGKGGQPMNMSQKMQSRYKGPCTK